MDSAISQDLRKRANYEQKNRDELLGVAGVDQGLFKESIRDRA